MIIASALLNDLKRELRTLEADLRIRAEDADSDWGRRLRDDFARAQAKERTGLPWIQWRDGEVSQAGVAWIIAAVFIRFAEDNELLRGAELDGAPATMPWIASPGDGLERAVENETAFYAAQPTMTGRDWLERAFRTLAALPAGRPLVDPEHSPVWRAPISAAAADELLAFFRRTTADGDLVHDFSDPELGTRFLGDLYQDLSEYAKKTFALLQTPDFVEEFILDLTLTPAIEEFGLTGLKLIDPTCGSGHFLLGAFERLTAAWAAQAPAVDLGERVQRALDSIHGVDLNPFAVAIARFRLTVAAINAAGIPSLVAAPAFRYHLAIGDSLLGGVEYNQGLDLGDGAQEFEYSAEDLQQHRDILQQGHYHVVVGNPPYITVKDKVLNARYRRGFDSCVGKYALSAPFAELFFRLAMTKPTEAGYVGQITSNSFMKREFGKKLVEQYFSGIDLRTSIDLTHVIDTSGAYIPGHGTPTVILVGRRRRPVASTLQAVLGVKGEPRRPVDPANGVVWKEITIHHMDDSFDGEFITAGAVERTFFSKHPWSLSGGGAAGAFEALEEAATRKLSSAVESIGFAAITGDDDFFARKRRSGSTIWEATRMRTFIEGEAVRDHQLQTSDLAIYPYPEADAIRSPHTFWPYRGKLRAGLAFQQTREDRGEWWGTYILPNHRRLAASMLITFAFVATHNHFVLDRGGKVFNRSAPVIKLPDGATEDEHFDLLGVLNSSTACFWLKQVSHNKGDSIDSRGARVTGEAAFDTYEFTGTKLEQFPLPSSSPRELTRALDTQSQLLEQASPRVALEGAGSPRAALADAQSRWEDARGRMIALQEEIDWQVYAAYGLVDVALAPEAPEIAPMAPEERPFEVRLARAIAGGAEQSSWFSRHGREPLNDVPSSLALQTTELWQARYDAAETGLIGMLERPEYKRRWAGRGWDALVAAAVLDALLDALEQPALWADAQGRPLVRSAAQVADALRHDERFRELVALHVGTADFDLTAEVGRLLDLQAVPAFAPLRYKESGLEKFRAWEQTWELQRAEDRGEQVDVPVPPKYTLADFRKSGYWSARGKLDVPKERFIAFPGSALPDDGTALYGWAGWDHGDRGLAIARLANELSSSNAPAEQVIPLLGALVELQPWLRQWHDIIDARYGVSPATAVAGILTSLLDRAGVGADTVLAWRPPAARRGRKASV